MELGGADELWKNFMLLKCALNQTKKCGDGEKF